MYYFSMKYIVYSGFLSFNLFFSFPGSCLEHHIIFNYHVIKLLLTVSISPIFLISVHLDSFEDHWSDILWSAHYWDLSDIFLMIRLELWVLRRKIKETKYNFNDIYQGCTLSTWLCVHVYPGHLAEVGLVSLLQGEAPFLALLLCCPLWKKVTTEI
jgi:hypothetical protein